MPWQPGQSGNSRGRPRQGASFAEVIAAEGISTKSAVAEFYERVRRGEPISYRWEDNDGIMRSGSTPPPKETYRGGVTTVYPTATDQLKAAEWLSDRMEPPQKNIKVDVTARAERMPVDRMLDTMTPEALRRLAGRPVEDAIDAECVEVEEDEDGNKETP